MKVLLVCAAGMSTGLLMNKMKAYWEKQNIDLQIDAVSISDYLEVYENYDVILVGPQLGYRLNDISKDSGYPCAVIPSFDYAIGNCENIMKLVEKLYQQK